MELKTEKLVGISQVKGWRMAFTSVLRGTKVLRGQKKVWEGREDERLVKLKQRDSPREPVRDNAELRCHPQEEGRAVTRGELACSCLSSNFTPKTTCDVCQSSANTSLSVPILDERKCVEETGLSF